MAELILSKDKAIAFIEERLDWDAETIVVTANGNGTYTGTATFKPPPQQAPAPKAGS
jgi:hypothetical protein